MILGSYRYEFALAFIDDIVIYSKNLEDHRLNVSLVLQALENVGMTVAENKCHFMYQDIELLGRQVSHLGLSTQKEKMEAIIGLPYPKTIGEVSTIFSQYNYHRDFNKNFAEITLPITKAISPAKQGRKRTLSMTPKDYARLRGSTPYPDRPEIWKAFDQLKQALS